MQIKLTPFDTLFVRDGKPFSMGEEVWANGIFPPPPSVIFGALRTAYFSQHLGELEEAGGPEDSTKDFRINQIFLARDREAFLPCPYDVVKSKVVRQRHAAVLNLNATDFNSSLPSSHCLSAPKELMPVTSLGRSHFLSIEFFKDYLAGENKIYPTPREHFVDREPKIGIQKSRETGSAQEGRLYRVEMYRPKIGTSLLVDWTAGSGQTVIPSSGLLKVGGEGKAVSYEQSKVATQIPLPNLTGNIIKLVLATPAVFEGGWLPKTIDANTLIGTWQGHSVRVLAASLGRPDYMGGFAMRTKYQGGGPKPMKRAVPAGSVYYLFVEGNAIEAAQAFHGHCVSEFDLEKQGYGLAFVGNVKEKV